MNTVAVLIIFVILATAIFLFANGTIKFNQENLDESIQSIPENLENVGTSAKDFAAETSTVLRKTINESLEQVRLDPIDTISSDAQKLPTEISQNNPLHQSPEIDVSELERKVHHLTNQYRTQNGLQPLVWDDSLSDIARNHSMDMALRNYFSHDTPEGKDPTDRANKHGYTCEKIVGHFLYIGIAENIFQNNLAHTIWYTAGIPTSYDWNSMDDIAQSTVDGWIDSLGHRKNILTETFDRQGIGVEIAQNGKVYITQNFC